MFRNNKYVRIAFVQKVNTQVVVVYKPDLHYK